MAIRNKGNKFQVDVSVKGVRAPRVSVDTYTEAEQIEARFKSHLLAGGDPAELAPEGAQAVAPDVKTLGMALDAAFKDNWQGRKAEASSLRNGTVWCDLLGYDFPLADLDFTAISKACDTLSAQGNKASTINRKVAALRVMIGAAVDRTWMLRRPKFPKFKEYTGRLRYYSDDEVNSLIDWVSGNPMMRDLFILAVQTGIRHGNLIGLTKRDIDLDRGLIKLEVNKGDKRRSVLITKEARRVLVRLVAGCAKDHDTLFPDVTAMKSKHISNTIKAWKASQGLPQDDEACFHTFRHTTCSRMVQAGTPILVVKEWMCHETLDTTMRYAHLAPDNLNLALAALENWGNTE